MPTQLPGGGWDISDEEAAEIGRVSERDAEVRRRSRLVNRLVVVSVTLILSLG